MLKDLFFLDPKFFCPKSFWPKILDLIFFWSQHFLPKFFWTQNFFVHKIFWTQNFSPHKVSWHPNCFQILNFFGQPLFGPAILWTQHFLDKVFYYMGIRRGGGRGFRVSQKNVLLYTLPHVFSHLGHFIFLWTTKILPMLGSCLEFVCNFSVGLVKFHVVSHDFSWDTEMIPFFIIVSFRYFVVSLGVPENLMKFPWLVLEFPWDTRTISSICFVIQIFEAHIETSTKFEHRCISLKNVNKVEVWWKV